MAEKFDINSLNAAQKQAVQTLNGPVLILAGAGTGKTRTVIELCDVLLQHGWVRHILFLADRNSLVTQAKRSFTNLLPNLDLTNLCESREHCNAACVFSTYQTMINCIDSVTDEEGKLFSPGHFDLVICDEAHRSIYNKYQDIFSPQRFSPNKEFFIHIYRYT